mmetsp:Transcript_784/g.1881  ORF Transcript_784/g.1881 Transcript_784/m.1881 type:complete len:221 (+) Transcript_784:39-701(+)
MKFVLVFVVSRSGGFVVVRKERVDGRSLSLPSCGVNFSGASTAWYPPRGIALVPCSEESPCACRSFVSRVRLEQRRRVDAPDLRPLRGSHHRGDGLRDARKDGTGGLGNPCSSRSSSSSRGSGAGGGTARGGRSGGGSHQPVRPGSLVFRGGGRTALSLTRRAGFFQPVFLALQFFGQLGVLFDLCRSEIQSPGGDDGRRRRRRRRRGGVNDGRGRTRAV